MPTASTPGWSAPRAGLLGDTGAVNHAAQINQFLGTHPSNAVYHGSSVLTPAGSGGTAWQYHLDAYDIDQPFTMSGTTIGRVTVPVLPVGAGADLIVSLYTNSAGAPGTLVTQTRVPAKWINQFAAVSGAAGPSGTLPVTQYTNNPLALCQFNTPHFGAFSSVNWPLPAVTSSGAAYGPAFASYGSAVVLIGGLAASGSSTLLPNVFTITADANGNAGPAVPQPPYPTPIISAQATVSADPGSGNLTIVSTGGQTVHATNPVALVYTAALNVSTGAVSAWSQQASLPVNLFYHGMASYNGYVYIAGGQTTLAGAVTGNVYFAQVVNGQITSWNTTASLPNPPESASTSQVAAIDGFLYVDFLDQFATHWTMYAPINPDGTLGGWQTLPTNPSNTSPATNNVVPIGSFGLAADQVDAAGVTVLGFGANGPDARWNTFVPPTNLYTGGFWFIVAPGNPGQWQWYEFGVPPSGTTSFYNTASVSLTPRISVPLPATGLTNGATYHIVLSQPNGDLNDYLRTHDDLNVFTGNPTLQTRAKGSGTWVAGTTGHAVPIQVFDNSNNVGAPNGNNQVIHEWDDAGARIATFVYATTPDARLLAVADAVVQPAPVLNMNPTFTNGTAPWGTTNAAVTQSSAHIQGGLPFSALMTPTGGVRAVRHRVRVRRGAPGPFVHGYRVGVFAAGVHECVDHHQLVCDGVVRVVRLVHARCHDVGRGGYVDAAHRHRVAAVHGVLRHDRSLREGHPAEHRAAVRVRRDDPGRVRPDARHRDTGELGRHVARLGPMAAARHDTTRVDVPPAGPWGSGGRVEGDY